MWLTDFREEHGLDVHELAVLIRRYGARKRPPKSVSERLLWLLEVDPDFVTATSASEDADVPSDGDNEAETPTSPAEEETTAPKGDVTTGGTKEPSVEDEEESSTVVAEEEESSDVVDGEESSTDTDGDASSDDETVKKPEETTKDPDPWTGWF